ncbi:ferric reductase-like transmembrane domain-containing protein [Actinokineospora bangkokensis]|uniref:Ferric reductase n=1 Tax=Actinokineospora bangkokensis TaxID=1193682 RepID=A0A1Q9LRS6_9PSEU|nr:ferric reductase-like transmembrane domain-containing protein [Actinokineospora bangkokensis]OLR94718.1 ferric reductase [Actinokineospora bangkokensis]
MVLWYISRATGLVSLALFTATLVLGLLTAGRFAAAGLPRFAVQRLHRNLSLLSLAFLVVHVVSAVSDGYVEIGLVDAVVPFASAYDPFWLGLGAVAFDLLLAVLITSLLRTRLPLEVWRGVHLASYASWPVALVHGFAMAGDDTAWVLGFDVVCVAAAAGALLWRTTRLHPDTPVRTP